MLGVSEGFWECCVSEEGENVGVCVCICVCEGVMGDTDSNANL